MPHRPPAALAEAVSLLERAVAYTRGSLAMVSPAALTNATPCAAWDLRALLAHMYDSLAALAEAADLGRVDLDVDPADPADLVVALRGRACRLLGAWTATGGEAVRVDGHPIAAPLVAGAGALEVAVHGWDVAWACGRPRPIPVPLASQLLALSAMLVTGDDRPARFAPPLRVPASAGPSDRLLAFLGRQPEWAGASFAG